MLTQGNLFNFSSAENVSRMRVRITHTCIPSTYRTFAPPAGSAATRSPPHTPGPAFPQTAIYLISFLASLQAAPLHHSPPTIGGPHDNQLPLDEDPPEPTEANPRGPPLAREPHRAFALMRRPHPPSAPSVPSLTNILLVQLLYRMVQYYR